MAIFSDSGTEAGDDDLDPGQRGLLDLAEDLAGELDSVSMPPPPPTPGAGPERPLVHLLT